MTEAAPNRLPVILILGGLMMISPLSIDMYLPAFPQIARALGTKPDDLAFTISSYFWGLAFGQLLYGPLLDRFGRTRPLYGGLVVYVVASFGCRAAVSLNALTAWRFIQALGGGVAGVAAIAMVRDFFPVRQIAKIISFLMLVLGGSPLLAPSLGITIAAAIGWKGVFLVQIAFAASMALLVRLFLPEGPPPDRSISLRVKPIVTTYLAVIKSRQFLVHALSGCLSFAVLFLYVGGSPIVFMEVFHTDPKSYAWIFGLLSVGWVGSNQLNVLLLRWFTGERLLFIGLSCQAVACLAFFVGALNGWYGLQMTIVMFFLCLSCLGLTFPNASANALAPFEKHAGSSSALLGFFQIDLAALATALLGAASAQHLILVTGAMATTSLLAWVTLVGGRRGSIVPEKIEKEKRQIALAPRITDAAGEARVGTKGVDGEVSIAVPCRGQCLGADAEG